MNVRSRARADDGLVGKVLVVWLLLAALIVVVAIDAGTILLARYRAADAAQEASFQASNAFERSHDRRDAIQAAVDAVAAKDEGGKITTLEIDPRTGAVTVTVTDTVSTMLAGRFGFSKDFTHVTASDTSEAPVP
jgi:Flp pilus assembly protein TadG